jgi:hypothetical protein
VTFQSSTGVASDVVLTYSATAAGDNFVVKLDGADYITIQNMTIKTATTGTFGRAIELSNGANYNIIVGNIIESVPGATSSTTAGIYSNTTLDEYNIISGNTIRHGYYSIYLGGPSTTSTENGNIIDNNILENYYYYGVWQSYQRNHVINGNKLSNASNSGVVYPLRTYYCYDATIVTKNRIDVTATSTQYIWVHLLHGWVRLRTRPCMPTTSSTRYQQAPGRSMVSTFTIRTMYLLSQYDPYSGTRNDLRVVCRTSNTSITFVKQPGGRRLGWWLYDLCTGGEPAAGLTTSNYNNLFYHGPQTWRITARTSRTWQPGRVRRNGTATSVSMNPQFYSQTILIPSNLLMNEPGYADY